MGRRRARFFGLPLAATVAASLLVGPPAVAGPDGPDGTTPRRRVDVVNFAFMPSSVTIARGTRVRWVNVSNRTHTTTSNTGLWSKRLAPGEAFGRLFSTAGTFRYKCTIHPDMTGRVVVTTGGYRPS